MRSKLAWTILRPTMIYGAPDDRNMIRLIGFLDRWPAIPVFGSGEYRQQPVHVDDVAKAVAAALREKRTVGKALDIPGGTAHTYNEILDLVAAALGKRARKLRFPYRPSLWAFRLYERVCSKPVIRSEQIMRLNEHKDFDRGEAEEAFGYDPMPFPEGIAREVSAFRGAAR